MTFFPRKLTFSILTCLLAACFVQSASADLTIRFSIDDGDTFDGNTFNTDFDMMTGESLTIGVYLVDDQANGVLETEGLLGFGLAAVASPSDLGTITSAAINPPFDPTLGTLSSPSFKWQTLTFTPPTVQEILLGRFEYSSVQTGTTLFVFTDSKPGSGTGNVEWLSGSLTELDEQIFGTGAAGNYQMRINSFSAVPEPGSLGCLAIVALGLAGRRRRRSVTI